MKIQQRFSMLAYCCVFYVSCNIRVIDEDNQLTFDHLVLDRIDHVNILIKMLNKRYENEHIVQEFQLLFHHVNVVELIPKITIA